MLIQKCDRCKKELETLDMFGLWLWKNYNIDFCKECYEKFKKFMEDDEI